MKKVAILFSGNGTNLENLLKELHLKKFNGFKIEVVATICNVPTAKGIEKSRNFGIEPIIINHKKYKNREEFDMQLVDAIVKSGAELTVLAGFMRFLTPIFTKNIKAINLHPSLLPLFKGGHAIQESFESDMKIGGVTVHYVNEELDGGSIIAQRCFQKDDKMSIEIYEKNIHDIEYKLLPEVVIEVLSKKSPQSPI
ncbi:MAG: phosphoribosylglycinamide formyltransferase [Campylobacteraceae bacterium]|nr:phosphoribosylglycinamide formyltransferase [Campylobacteraceae bacterium]